MPLQCSYKTCEPDENLNRAVILQFERHIESQNRSISCYYDPWFKDYGAVLSVQKPGNEVVFAVLIPAASLLVALLTCLCFCKWCRNKENLNKTKTNTTTTTTTSTNTALVTSPAARDTTRKAAADEEQLGVPLYDIEEQDSPLWDERTAMTSEKENMLSKV